MKKTYLLLSLCTFGLCLTSCMSKSSSNSKGKSGSSKDVEMTEEVWGRAVSLEGYNGTYTFYDTQRVLCETKILSDQSFHVSIKYTSDDNSSRTRNYYLDGHDEDNWVFYEETGINSDAFKKSTFNKNQSTFSRFLSKAENSHPQSVLENLPFNPLEMTKAGTRTWKTSFGTDEGFKGTAKLTLDEQLYIKRLEFGNESYAYILVGTKQGNTSIDFSYPEEHLTSQSGDLV